MDRTIAEHLARHQARQTSQHGEDGVIARLFALVGTTNRFFVEFGVESGHECNTRRLLDGGWSGLMMDRNHENADLPLFRECVSVNNINRLFAKYGVPRSFDLLSIDVDGNDYWIWQALARCYRPRVVVIEFNAAVPVGIKVAMPYQPAFFWRGEACIGASLSALAELGLQKGYCLIFAEPPNAFFVARELLPQAFITLDAAQALRLQGQDLHPGQRERWERQLRHGRWTWI